MEGETFDEEEGDTNVREYIDKARREERDSWIKKMYEKTDMSQRDLAKDTGLSVSRINEIVNSD